MSKTAVPCSAVMIAFLAAATAAQAQTHESDIRIWHPLLSAGSTVSTDSTSSASRGRLRPLGAALCSPASSADDLNPNLTPWASAQVRMHNELVKKGHRAFSAQSRCWPGGTPGQLLFLQPLYFIQTPQEVWMIWERDHQVRRIYLNREHSQNPKPSWFGESVGHYENGELVIDTVGFIEHPLSFVDSFTTPHTKDLHVVERWKLNDGGNGFEAIVTVDDPGAFEAPWSGIIRGQKVNRPKTEWACAENNQGYEQAFGLQEYQMPVANTPNF